MKISLIWLACFFALIVAFQGTQMWQMYIAKNT